MKWKHNLTQMREQQKESRNKFSPGVEKTG